MESWCRIFFQGVLGGKSCTWRSAILAAGLVLIVVFPDVIFWGKSILPSDVGRYTPKTEAGLPAASSYLPEPGWRDPSDQFRDLGALIWQLEPAIAFMKKAIWHGQSPFWNPHIGTGALGIETLADTKTSVFVLLPALLGGGTRAFHGVLFAIYFAALACLYRILRYHLYRSVPATLVGCFFFMMNGFAIGNLASQVAHVYFLAPIVLCVLLGLITRPSYGRFLGAVAANAVMMMETFVPVLLLLYSTVLLLVFLWIWRMSLTARQRGILVAMTIASVVVGFGFTAPIWFPSVCSLSATASGVTYNDRAFGEGAQLVSFLSLFTPKHFWESYHRFAIRHFADITFETHFCFHLGIVAAMVGLQALTWNRFRRNGWYTVLGLVFMVTIWRMFATFPLTEIRYLPVLRSIRYQYWPSVPFFLFVFFLAQGVDDLGNASRWRLLPYLALLAMMVSYACLWRQLGFPKENWYRLYIVLIPLIAAVPFILFWSLRHTAHAGVWVKVVVLVLIVLELHFYMNHFRPERGVRDKWPPMVRFLTKNVGDTRILNLGRRLGVMPNWACMYGLEQIGNVNTQSIKWYESFFRRDINDCDPKIFLQILDNKPFNLDEKALDLLGVKYVVYSKDGFWKQYETSLRDECKYTCPYESKDVRVLENPNPYPHAYAVDRLVEARQTPVDVGLNGRLQAFTEDEDLLREAVIWGISGARVLDGVIPETNGVSIQTYRNARVVLVVEVDKPVVVVVTDAWHPGWRATLDGKSVHVGRVNEAFRGIVTPAGKHVIEMRYTPPGLWAGVGIAASSLIILTLAGVLVYRRRADVQ